MAKYSESFKVMVVQELGIELLARKHGVKSHRQVLYWVNAFKQFGATGLSRKKKNEVYTIQFKLDVLSFMKRTGASLSETALHFWLKNPPIIASWKKKFLEGGAGYLGKPKGRPAMSERKKDVKKGKKPIQQDEMTHEQKLERENELLRLEVAYLKKLRAFQMDPDGYLEKHRQRYHSNSKKNSD